jgi:alanine transaminase
MYIFPRVRLPAAAVAEAKKQNLAPDLFYAIQLLDNTGVVVVPVSSTLLGCWTILSPVVSLPHNPWQGSGFGQRDGTYHFRTTMLPPEREIDVVSSSFAAFHSGFMKKFGSACEV